MQGETQNRHWNAAGKCFHAEQAARYGLQQSDRSDAAVGGERDSERDVKRASDGAAHEYRQDVGRIQSCAQAA